MANEPISALTLFTSYSTADEVEILDVSDTTFASTGTNKRIPFSTLLTMAGVGSGTGGGSGTVTSVGLSLPPFITVTGSPVSTSGTLTGTLATQTANTHFAGPTSGSAAAPTFRPLVPADLPTTGLTITQHSGTITTDTESAGAVTCNLATSDWHLVVLNANVSVSISNPTVGQQFVLVFQQAASGGPYSISSWFSGTINWMGSPYTAPSMPATALAYLAVTFKCISSGVYLAWWTGNSNV